MDENGHALKAATDTISCFVDVLTFFCKRQLLPVSLTLFHFETQLQKWKQASLLILSLGVLLAEATVNICSEKFC